TLFRSRCYSPPRRWQRESTRGRGDGAMPDLPIPEPPGFSDLTKAEQIRYLQALWDRIADQPGELPAPESHLQLAEDRLASYRSDPYRARPAHDVLDRLAKKSP